MTFEYLFVFLLAFLGVFNLTPLMIKFANKINFVDNPEARKMHKKAVPLLGGLAVFIGFISLAIYDILLASTHTFDARSVGFLLGALIIVIVGLIDDKRGMSPKAKLAGQIISSLIFIYCNDLQAIFFNSPWLTVPILVMWMAGLMNAFNFLDNMDGILAGMSGILAVGFFIFASITHTPVLSAQTHFISILALTFAGAVFGFLPHNFNPAKIFLGDTGSMFIGYFLGALGILMGRLSATRMNSDLYYVLPILLLSYAIFDISLVSYTRHRDGRHVLEGGKDHSTHRIGTATGSTKQTALIVYLINCFIVALSMLIFKYASVVWLITSTAIFCLGFILFGKKLDKIPIIIPHNQIKQKKGESCK